MKKLLSIILIISLLSSCHSIEPRLVKLPFDTLITDRGDTLIPMKVDTVTKSDTIGDYIIIRQHLTFNGYTPIVDANYWATDSMVRSILLQHSKKTLPYYLSKDYGKKIWPVFHGAGENREKGSDTEVEIALPEGFGSLGTEMGSYSTTSEDSDAIKHIDASLYTHGAPDDLEGVNPKDTIAHLTMEVHALQIRVDQLEDNIQNLVKVGIFQAQGGLALTYQIDSLITSLRKEARCPSGGIKL